MRGSLFVVVCVVLGTIGGVSYADVRPDLRASVANEQALLQIHFAELLDDLQARDTRSLTGEQRAARARAIGYLRDYRESGVFPKNRDFTRRTPYFIDGDQTRCAMAYLIEQSGSGDLVERVARTANNAYVRELVADDEFRAWLVDNGLTAAEAARIQPSYEPPTCDPVCRTDEACVPDEDDNTFDVGTCSRECIPNANDPCPGESQCTNFIDGSYACWPALPADSAIPPPDEEGCSVGGNGTGALALLLLVVVGLVRRQRGSKNDV